MRLKRYWRFGVAALVVITVGAILRGTWGLIVGVLVAVTLIAALERTFHRGRLRQREQQKRSD
jgi:predicted PurR-regulated permease PerM